MPFFPGGPVTEICPLYSSRSRYRAVSYTRPEPFSLALSPEGKRKEKRSPRRTLWRALSAAACTASAAVAAQWGRCAKLAQCDCVHGAARAFLRGNLMRVFNFRFGWFILLLLLFIRPFLPSRVPRVRAQVYIPCPISVSGEKRKSIAKRQF